MSLKKMIGKLHLWLGLASGFVVFMVAITGCIYAFEHEIQELSQPYRFVQEIGDQALPPTRIAELAEAAAPGMQARRVYYEQPQNSAMVLFYSSTASYYYIAFVDQYTGEVLKVKNLRKDFFTIILYLHISLLLPYGETIIGVASLIFLVLLISGIYLWWPRNKNKKAVKQKFRIKWDARWRRKNYDLHSVFGFYASWIAIFVVITGLIWSFDWMKQAVHYAFSGGDQLAATIVPTSAPKDSSRQTAIDPLPLVDQAWYMVLDEDPEILGTAVYLPYTPTDVITIYSSPDYGKFGRLDWRYFDQYTGEEYPVDHYRGRHTEATVAQKVLKLNYDIHTGGVLGLAGKFIAFFSSLFVASLPITGFLLWRGRRKKQKTKKKSVASEVAVA